jgi:hypothetical protein
MFAVGMYEKSLGHVLESFVAPWVHKNKGLDV